ncbi:hypothetical protein [Anatilimnocola floriformis]|uniref:hypothetical protein n=1 Tax=Anatilimnocola floriformis TaxID=2948575 RepID=UPI0020C2723D|nr:hypothetical protein [Anatilimnocola floriformis]
MAAEPVLSADERRGVVERRLDELDRLLLGLLPRGERLALVASVEGRVRELGGAVDLGRDLPEVLTATATASTGRRRRSRLAFSSGVLGIVVAAGLLASPVLFIVLSIFGELLGEAFAILLLVLLALLITCGGGLAVFCGGVSILRLARRGQTATGTGWAITGLCTGALPLLIGLVGVLSLGVELIPSDALHVSWNISSDGSSNTPLEPVAYPAPPMYGTPPASNEAPAMLPPAGSPSLANELPSAPKAEAKTEESLSNPPADKPNEEEVGKPSDEPVLED